MTKEEFKAKWLEALRSGRYKQGQGFLRCGDEYCCLGVALDIINPKGWSRRNPEHQDSAIFVHEASQDTLSGKSDSFVDTGEVPLNGLDQIDLANMNDDGLSFGEIANFIEKNL